MVMSSRVVRLHVALLVVAALAGGCASRTPPAVGDVRLALRVRTAILNDTSIGTLPIDVRATGGQVTLTGRVRSAAEADRAVQITQTVAGVTGVTPALTIDPEASTTPPPVPPGPSTAERRHQGLVGVGASVRFTPSTGIGLGTDTGLGPIFRLPVRGGFGPAIGFSWLELPIDASPQGTPGLARLRIRPVMAGLAWGHTVDRTSLVLSLVGGWSFNAVRADPTQVGPFRAIHATDAFVWRPGISVWQDLGRRIGINVFVGGLFQRPDVTFASDDALTTTRFHSDTLVVSAGLAYWLF